MPSQVQAEHSLTLADVLEEELQAICGVAAPPPLPWTFEPAQVLMPLELRARLVGGTDAVARGLAGAELGGLVERLKSVTDSGEARVLLAEAFNGLLERDDLYVEGAARFAGVRFRSCTRERILGGPVRERNRLLLEDAFPELQSRDDARLARAFAKAHERGLAALCLSGGGIRSATFALGVVQGLARLGQLGRFHYLSTVSGGGYLGGWLSAWMHRADRERVQAELTEHTGRPLAPEPAPLSHIRSYSSYLSPRLGALSIDTWTLAAIYVRNLVLNWLVLIPVLTAALALPQLLLAVARLPYRESAELSTLVDAASVMLLALSVLGTIAAARYVHANRPVRGAHGAVDDPKRDQRAFVAGCLAPTVTAMVSLTLVWAWIASGKVSLVSLPSGPATWELALALGDWSARVPSAWAWGGFGALAHFCGWLLAARRLSAAELLFVLATGALAGLAAGLLAHGLVPAAAPRTAERLEQYAWYVSLMVPALLAIVLFLGHAYVGATSRSQIDAMFEWNARYGAWLLIVIFAWLAGCGVVILAPLGLAAAVSQITNTELLKYAHLVASALGVVAGAVTLRTGYKAPLAGGDASLRTRAVQALALPVFVVVLLALLSDLAGWLMDLPQHLSPFFDDLSCPSGAAAAGGTYDAALQVIVCGSAPSALVVVLGLLLVGLVLSFLVDTNRFSLHGMYRARLIRTFLGASRPAREREPNPFTGFDEHDDVALADLWPRGRPAPLHVVNVALNLVTGEELASHQRKAVSFTFSPLHSGSWRVGYRPTRDYGGGITLGTAITISGAAASPEMGYHSKPLHSFLLTLFNIRLGWWLGNPGFSGRRNYRDAAPASSVMPILDEALGRTDDRNANVYLSDGGHFENLGLYEMVLRRCRFILVSDAGCDPDCSFEDLGNAIRRIRVDFGIPITFASVPIYSRAHPETHKADAAYCAVGRIGYSAVDGAVEDGTLVYVKPAFYGAEPPDVFNYAHTSPGFPHEPTADQFFTEAQFESYRRLGAHVVESVEALLRPQAGEAEARVRTSSGTR